MAMESGTAQDQRDMQELGIDPKLNVSHSVAIFACPQNNHMDSETLQFTPSLVSRCSLAIIGYTRSCMYCQRL